MASDTFPLADAPDLIHRLAGARLLLVAPHPDDESLALAGLIRHAVRQKAHVRILQVTDGDNNPWPQRWLEKRWCIGPQDRRRWAKRRSEEALHALRRLGLGETSRRRLGWPDLGVTGLVQKRGVGIIREMAEILREEAADLVVLPALGDTHPDHSACHVLLRMAMRHLARQSVCLTYHVHGRRAETGRSIALPLDASMREDKRRAILAHQTQVATARRRLLAKATDTEILHVLPVITGAMDSALPETLLLPWRPVRAGWHRLRLTLAHPDGVHVWNWRDAPLVRHREVWHLHMPEALRRGPVCARLEMRSTSPWIFDHWGWRDLTRHTPARQADR